FAPWVGNALYLSGLTPLPGLDLTPFAFAISGIALTWGIWRFRLLDLVPVARDALIERMSDGVLVLDVRNRIVDINPAACRMIGRSSREAIGRSPLQILSQWPDLIARYRNVTDVSTEIVVGRAGQQYSLELSISPLYDRSARFNGRLIVFHDITMRKQA